MGLPPYLLTVRHAAALWFTPTSSAVRFFPGGQTRRGRFPTDGPAAILLVCHPFAVQHTAMLLSVFNSKRRPLPPAGGEPARRRHPAARDPRRPCVARAFRPRDAWAHPARRRSQPARGRRPVRGAVRRRREKAARRRSVMAAQKSGVAAAQRPPRSDARIQSDKIEAFLIKTSKKAFLGRTFYNPQGVSSPLPLRRDARCPPPSQKCGENAVQVLFLCGKDTAGKQNQ